MSNNKGIIIGDNNKLEHEFEQLTAIGVNDRTFTEADDGKIFLGENVEIDENGVLQGTMSPASGIETSNFVTIAARKNYFCNAAALNIVVTLNGALAEYTFVKTDGTANTITLTPSSGLINGAASFVLTTQYQKVTVIYDGTNYYV